MTGQPAALAGTRTLLESWAEAGSSLGAQVAVYQAGTPIADFATGQSAPGGRASTADVGRLYCAAKPLTACCVARAVDLGLCAVDDAVGKYLPAFDRGRRQSVTLRGLMSHTSGLPDLMHADPYGHQAGWVLAAASELEFPDRFWYRKPHYNNTSAWYVLAAVVERLYDQPLDDVVREQVGKPLGLSDLAFTQDERNHFADCYQFRGNAVIALPGPDHHQLFRDVNPAHGGFGSARSLGALFVELNRCVRGAGDLISTPVAREFVRRQADVEIPGGHGDHPYGLGFFLDVGRSWVGGGWAERSFGHHGFVGRQAVVGAFADPDADVVLSIRLFSAGPRNNWMFHRIGQEVWSDLGLSANHDRERAAST
ncbi:serine hydrolase domain-containing protein [Fodinicola acaciae]|uniref:serine hydrolase domain-containing protein n=1 Tax=Fodinicola acaciae TaxID=2681555 RepID=UPI0013D49CBC|nr:serine hydrolase domain-containing protein [Fodinicola acaciae]